MANRGWNSKNHYPHNNAQIACRLCSQVFPNREGLIAHIDSHLAREEVNFGSLQTHHQPKASSRGAFRSNQLAAVPNNLPIRTSQLPSNLQQVNRNVFETQPEVNRNVFENRPPPAAPDFNRNGFDSRSLMQKVTRSDFNNLPLMQEGNRIINNAANTQTFSWTNNQPRPGQSVTPVPAPPPPKRNPSLLTYVPPNAPAGSLQPAQLGFSTMTSTRNSTRSGATHHHRPRSQQRNVEEVRAAATTEQTTRPFIDMLETPIKKVDFIDLENMEEDESSSIGSRKKKLDLALKL